VGVAIINPITLRDGSDAGVVSAALVPKIAYEVATVLPSHRPANPLVTPFWLICAAALARPGRGAPPWCRMVLPSSLSVSVPPRPHDVHGLDFKRRRL
jgi:hypothetical protein